MFSASRFPMRVPLSDLYCSKVKMAARALIRAGRINKVFNNRFNQIFTARTALRAASGVSKDFLPGPYPQNLEERAAAAKKYNLLPEDYQPYPDNGSGYGDYPMLPNRSQQERDPWYNWDHPDLRRNWGEPMHWDFDMYIRNRVDTSPSPVDWSTMSKTLLGFVGFMLLMFGLGEVFPAYQPVAPKQFPFNDLYLERGGDPDKQPEPVKHYEI